MRKIRLQKPDVDVEYDAALSRFIAAAHECLMYSQDVSDSVRGGDSLFSQSLRRRLVTAFYDLIFVDRPEIHEIARLLTLRRLLILVGDRGSGKTTILKKLELDLALVNESPESATNVTLRYYDFKQYSGSLEAEDGAKETVCDIVYSDLYKHFLSGRHDDLWQWHVFLVRRCRKYRILRESIELYEKTDSNDDWRSALETERYRDVKQRIEQDNPPSATETLDLFFRFLLEELGQHCVLIIDNIDQYKISIQDEVVTKAFELSAIDPPAVTPLVAVRTTSLDRLASEGGTEIPYLLKKIDPTRQMVELHTEPTLVATFMKRRLDFLASVEASELFQPGDLRTLAKALGLESGDAFIGAHAVAFDWLRREIAKVDVVSSVALWHNNSLRTTATHVFNLLNAHVTNRDPLFQYKDIIASTTVDSRSIDHPGARSLRTVVYRRLVLGGRCPPEEPETKLLFRDLQSATPSRHLFFPLLKILQYLENRPGGRVEYSQLVADFDSLGVSHRSLFDDLLSLLSRRGFDISGLIYIDKDPKRVSMNMPSNTMIEIVPAGRFMIDPLSTSCEYLFWCAIYADVDEPLFKKMFGKPKIELKDIYSDEFRLRTATTFLVDGILPRFRQELSWPAEQRNVEVATELGRYRELFGRDFFITKAVESLRRFSVYAELDPDDVSVVTNQLKIVEQEVALLWPADLVEA